MTRKNEIVLRMIHEHGVDAYPGSRRYLEAAREAGLRPAVVSSSTNTREVLKAAGIEGLFEAVIDGVVAELEHLKGKPAPDTYLAGRQGSGRQPGWRCGVRGRARGRRGRPRRGLRLRGRGRPGGPCNAAPGRIEGPGGDLGQLGLNGELLDLDEARAAGVEAGV